jgi:hypothetical protein
MVSLVNYFQKLHFAVISLRMNARLKYRMDLPTRPQTFGACFIVKCEIISRHVDARMLRVSRFMRSVETHSKIISFMI